MQKNSWAGALLSFYQELSPPDHLPGNIEWLYPQQDPQVLQVVENFLLKFYNDPHSRTLMLGINPGRFGAGVTGVNFTAARQLTQYCGIDHAFKNGSELSAEFIYDMIKAFGGPQKFYSRYFIGSVSPLGFVQGGKNLNYYDDKELLRTVEPFIITNLEKLMRLNVNRDLCFCIGGEKNYKYLAALNERHHWFSRIIALPHPRFIMQYRRRQKKSYINLYLQQLRQS